MDSTLGWIEFLEIHMQINYCRANLSRAIRVMKFTFSLCGWLAGRGISAKWPDLLPNAPATGRSCQLSLSKKCDALMDSDPCYRKISLISTHKLDGREKWSDLNSSILLLSDAFLMTAWNPPASIVPKKVTTRTPSTMENDCKVSVHTTAFKPP